MLFNYFQNILDKFKTAIFYSYNIDNSIPLSMV